MLCGVFQGTVGCEMGCSGAVDAQRRGDARLRHCKVGYRRDRSNSACDILGGGIFTGV